MVYRNQSKEYLLLHPTNSKDSSKKMVTVAAAKQLIYTPNLVVANLRFDGCGGINYLFDISFHLLNEDRKTVPVSEVEYKAPYNSNGDEYQKICTEILKKPGYLIEFRKFSSGLDLFMNMTRMMSKITQSYSIQSHHNDYFKKVFTNCSELMRAATGDFESVTKQPDARTDKLSCQLCKKYLSYNPKIGQLEYPSFVNGRTFVHLKCEEERASRQ